MKQPVIRLTFLTFFVLKALICIGEDDLLCITTVGMNKSASCDVFLHSSPTCLVCPTSRDGKGHRSWYKSENQLLYVDEVLVGKGVNTLPVNECGSKNYTLSIAAINLNDGGMYRCSLNGETLATFYITVKDTPTLVLRCKSSTTAHCVKQLRYNMTMEFECQIRNTKGSFNLSWSVDETTLITKQYYGRHRSILDGNETTTIKHTFIGTEKGISCQICGPHIIETKVTLPFTPIKKVNPALQIIWNNAINPDFIALEEHKRVVMYCRVENVNYPVTLSWEVDNHEVSSRYIAYPEEKIVDVDQHTERNETTQMAYSFDTSLDFTPTKWWHTIECVCKGPLIFERKVSVSLSVKGTGGGQGYIVAIVIGVLLVIGFPILIHVLLKKKAAGATPRQVKRLTDTIQSHQSNRYVESPSNETTQDYDIYYGVDITDILSNYVKLVNRISETGRLERWEGELSRMIYDKTMCVASTCGDNASESDKALFRTLIMYVKDSVNHENVVQTIGIEIQKEPYFIYTEYLGLGNLKDFLKDQQGITIDSKGFNCDPLRFAQEVSSALVYLQSMKHESSASTWKLAPETIAKKEHSYQSDSWSLAAFICEVYCMGADPTKTVVSSLYEVPSSYHDFPFSRPQLCPEFMYQNLRIQIFMLMQGNNLIKLSGANNILFTVHSIFLITKRQSYLKEKRLWEVCSNN
ncbi:hypothetical protein HOLleu_22722 [Holothuria leucospilota]|uniref:Ig-like domain-containing protein n=1 Tax=Holothuria leucospilota TaxID=206669 RepID=A0A9Q1BZN0_HOLLE|nr:hypothetical protein HOLleu_22722 [Holothuria leucospilota]